MGGGTPLPQASLVSELGPCCWFSLVDPKCPATRGKLWAVTFYFCGIGYPKLITRIIAKVLTHVLVNSHPTA